MAGTGAAACARAEESALSSAIDRRESGARAAVAGGGVRRGVSARARPRWATEIANLKNIIGRFSDFSKMPKPELERIDAKDVVERVRALYANARAHEEAKIQI